MRDVRNIARKFYIVACPFLKIDIRHWVYICDTDTHLTFPRGYYIGEIFSKIVLFFSRFAKFAKFATRRIVVK